MQLNGDGDDEHDQQHQHHINQRRGVDIHHHLGFFEGLKHGRLRQHGLFRLWVGDEAHLGEPHALCRK